MSVQGDGLYIGQFVAGVNLPTPYVFGKISANKIILPQAGQYADGVIQETYNIGQAVNLMFLGIAKVTVGASAIPEGSFVTTDANGCAIPVAVGNFVLGKSLEIGAPGQVIQIMLLNFLDTSALLSIASLKPQLISLAKDVDVKAAIKTAATT